MRLWDAVYRNKGSSMKKGFSLKSSEMTGEHRGLLACLLLGGFIFGLDQRLKNAIEEDRLGLPRDMDGRAGRYVRLCRHHNAGFSMGRMKDRPDVVIHSTALGMTAVLAAFLKAVRDRGSLLERLGLMLVLSGAASNFYDRLKRGYVVDFLIIKAGVLKRLVINIGDAAIAAGSLLYVFGTVLYKKKDR